MATNSGATMEEVLNYWGYFGGSGPEGASHLRSVVEGVAQADNITPEEAFNALASDPNSEVSMAVNLYNNENPDNKYEIPEGKGRWDDSWQRRKEGQLLEEQQARNEEYGYAGNGGQEESKIDDPNYQRQTLHERQQHGDKTEAGATVEEENNTATSDSSDNSMVYDDESKLFTSSVEELEEDFNGEFDTNDIELLIGNLKNINAKIEDISPLIDSIDVIYDEINEDTKKKLSSEFSASELKANIQSIIKYWLEFVGKIQGNLSTIMGNVNLTDESWTPTDGGTPGGVQSGGSSSGYSGSSSSGSEAPDIDNVDPNGTSNDVYIESAVVGTLAFSALVPLYSELGKPSTIQSSLTGEYEVVGIFQYENEYYYRIYDKNLKQFYFAKIDNNSKFTTEYVEVLKMNEDAMMLTSPTLGDNVLAKMSDINTVYFVNGTVPGEGEAEGITFVNVLDGTDGKNYYIPLSDSVEMATLDAFKASILDTNTTTETPDVTNNVG